MAIAAGTTIVLAVVMLVFVVGGIFLEIFLARRKAKWPGLVLPGLTFLYTLVMALNITSVGHGAHWGPLLGTLVLGNIPTVILLAIYFACREKQGRDREQDKMRIEDL